MAAHGLVLAGFAGLGLVLTSRPVARDATPIKVVVIAPKPPAPKPPQVEQPTPKPARREPIAPRPKVLAKAPPPEPITPPRPSTPTSQAPRRIVGLSLDSTTTDGGGPAFAVGNTRMGETAAVATDPRAVSSVPLSSNRVSSRVPKAGVALTAPVKQRAVVPEYPQALRAQGIEADVVLVITVAIDGTVSRVDVAKAGVDKAFVAAAVAAAAQEQYAPATRDGEPITYDITLTVRFRLSDY